MREPDCIPESRPFNRCHLKVFLQAYELADLIECVVPLRNLPSMFLCTSLILSSLFLYRSPYSRGLYGCTNPA